MPPSALTTFSSLAPPVYGEHQFDQLYSEIDLSGFMTPAGGASGVGTPFASQSRSGSTENLTSMDAVASPDSTENVLAHPASGRWGRDRPYHPSGSVDEAIEGSPESPQSCQIVSWTTEHVGNSRGSSNRGSSNPMSRRTSGGESVPSQNHSSEHIEFNSEDLAKVPSYSTALRSRATAPINDGLPNYQTAIQAPMSQPSPPTPQVPSPVGIRRSPEDRTP